jgi:5-methylcytosine-specific restriction endonuclease McrA
MMYPKPKKVHKRRLVIAIAQRNRLLARAGGQCERCGDPFDFRGPQFSHITPKGMGGTRSEYSDDEIEVLCAKCHSAEHGIMEV